MRRGHHLDRGAALRSLELEHALEHRLAVRVVRALAVLAWEASPGGLLGDVTLRSSFFGSFQGCRSGAHSPTGLRKV